MSDSFSDEDDLFNNPETLARADQVEKIHIQATQGAGAAPIGPRKTSMAVPAIYASRSTMRDRLGMTRTAAIGNGNRGGVRTMTVAGSSITAPAKPLANLAPRPAALALNPPGSHTNMDDTEHYPEISVMDDGRYVLAGSQGAGNAAERPIAGPSRTTAITSTIPPAPVANGPLSQRRPLSRSISMNVQSQSSQQRTHRASQSTSHLAPPGAAGPTFPLAPRAFTRTVSAATEKRRAAIEDGLGMNPSASQVERCEAANGGSVSPALENEMRSRDARHAGGGDIDRMQLEGGAEALRADMERMKKQVEELAQQRKLAEERAQQAQDEIYRFKGEAEHVRRKLGEQVKTHQLLEQTMKKKIDEMQDNIDQDKLKHRREIETVMTAHAFKTHNLLTSASKPRHPGSTQRPTASQAIRGTPTRHHSMAYGYGGGLGGVNGIPLVTPSKSPTKGKRAQSMAVGLGGAFVDGDSVEKEFVTPFVPYKKVKKAKEPLTPFATTPAFKGLQNSFLGDSAVAAGRAAKRLKSNEGDCDAIQTPSKSGAFAGAIIDDAPASSPHIEDNAGMAWNGETVASQDDDVQMQEVDDDVPVFQVAPDDRTVKSEILRVVFSHVSPSSISPSVEPPLPTVQKILNLQPSDDESEDVRQLLTDECAALLSFFGEDPYSARDMAGRAFRLIWSLAHVVSWMKETVTQIDVLESIFSLLTDLAHRVHVWQEAHIMSGRLQPLLTRVAGVYLPAPPPPAAGQSKSDASKHAVANASRKFVPASDGQSTKADALANLRSRLGQTFCRFVAIHGADNRLNDVIDEFLSHPTGLPLLLQTCQPFDVVSEAIELASSRACHHWSFRALLSSPATDTQHDLTRPPVVDILCRYLLDSHPSAPSVRSTTFIRLKVVHFFSMLAAQSHEAVLILGEAYYLVPTLVKAMERESEVIWGLTESEDGLEGPFTLLIGIVSLLHYLVFPPPPPSYSLFDTSQIKDNIDQPPIGIDLLSKLRSSMPSASSSRGPAAKEFNGLHHMFIVAIGRISYADVDQEVGRVGGWAEEEIRALQYLAQDLLESVVEGPEGDSIYEVYVNSKCEETAEAQVAIETEARNAGDVGEIEVIDLEDEDEAM